MDMIQIFLLSGVLFVALSCLYLFCLERRMYCLMTVSGILAVILGFPVLVLMVLIEFIVVSIIYTYNYFKRRK